MKGLENLARMAWTCLAGTEKGRGKTKTEGQRRMQESSSGGSSRQRFSTMWEYGERTLQGASPINGLRMMGFIVDQCKSPGSARLFFS